MFDPKTTSEIGYYVYCLIDPRNNKPFYIGKGKENRVFEHLKCSENLDIENGKFELIREIQNNNQFVKHIILRHNIESNDEALRLESTIIETLIYFDYDLKNLVLGHNSDDEGIMDIEAIQAKYHAEKLKVEDINDSVVLININKNKFDKLRNDEAIYQATKQAWVIGKERDKAKYVLSEYRGLIVGVFEIVDQWYLVDTYKTAKKTMSRWGFKGINIKNSQIGLKYFNKSVADLKLRGASNPIRLFIK